MGAKRVRSRRLALLLLAAAVALARSGGARDAGGTAAAEDPACSAVRREASPIARENCLPGADSRDWDVSGAGDHSLQGFAANISYPSGATAEFYVTSPVPTIQADIYRLGYYGGAGARLVDSLQVRGLQKQPACRWDHATLLYDCSNWRKSFVWKVPPGAVSGLYFARISRNPTPTTETWRADGSSMGAALAGNVFAKAGQPAGSDPEPLPGPHAYGRSGAGRLASALRRPHASHIWFVVRNDRREADILFQTSDTTWQAYNRWGGVGTYGGSGVGHGAADYGGQGLDPSNPRRRAFKVSYNRPLVTRDYRSINMPLGAEYPMIRFLEKHGYDVNYAAGVDTDRMGAELLGRHRAFLSVGHDEYWSGPQRANVEAARDHHGMHLMFLSGNEVFWRIRWEDSHRTMVCYKETQADWKLDPNQTEWTGTFRDSRAFNPLGPDPENSLTGQIFTVNAWRNDPLVVPGRYRSLRFWRDTAVASTPASQPVALLRGLLGHEWDEDLDNGFRPRGLIHLSETSVDNVMYIQDWGSAYDSGTGVHHLALYKAASGALVFGAGTVQWSWGLDGHHDGASGVPPERANPYNTRLEEDILAPEPSVQQATVNLFADMGIQPSALDRSPALKIASPSNDTAPPNVSITELSITLPRPAPAGSPEPTGSVVIEASASDLDGQVAMVEVSLDGGHSWHQAEPAAGEDAASPLPGHPQSWLAEVTELSAAVLKHVKATTVMARAVDDSLNMHESTGTVPSKRSGQIRGNHSDAADSRVKTEL